MHAVQGCEVLEIHDRTVCRFPTIMERHCFNEFRQSLPMQLQKLPRGPDRCHHACMQLQPTQDQVSVRVLIPVKLIYSEGTLLPGYQYQAFL